MLAVIGGTGTTSLPVQINDTVADDGGFLVLDGTNPGGLGWVVLNRNSGTGPGIRMGNSVLMDQVVVRNFEVVGYSTQGIAADRVQNLTLDRVFCPW